MQTIQDVMCRLDDCDTAYYVQTIQGVMCRLDVVLPFRALRPPG